MNCEALKGSQPQLDVAQVLSQIEKLQTQRHYRSAKGLHFVEGIRNFVQVVDTNAAIQTLVWNDKLLTAPIARKLVRRLRRNGIPSARVTPEQFRQISSTARASGVGAILQQQWATLSNINPKDQRCWIAIEKVRSPGNLGSLIRSSEAVAASGFILLGDAVDPYDPAVVRASMGAVFHQRFIRTSHAKLAHWVSQHQGLVVGASPEAEYSYYELNYDQQPLIIMLGEERKGLTDGQRSLCKDFVSIPINGHADSLNLAVAGSLLLYEVFRRNNHALLKSC